MNTKQKLDNWDSHISSYPKFLQFFIFINRGFFNSSGWKTNYKRILCYFNRHEWSLFMYGLGVKEKVKFYESQEGVDGYALSFSLQCKDCGIVKMLNGEYRGYDEYRITE